MSQHLNRLAAVIAAVSLCGIVSAQAQIRHPAHPRTSDRHAVLLAEIKAPPLTIKKRSFLDPGNVVPQGSATPEYIAANTTELSPIYNSYAPGRFGDSTLPGRFDLPNNPRFYPQQNLDFSPF